LIVTGKIKEACPEEVDNIIFLPEIMPCDISIDSKKKLAIVYFLKRI
jgi:hypothetical protein